MRTGPSCPLRLGLLDSPDYWTDSALMSAVRPLSAEETYHMTEESHRSETRAKAARDRFTDWASSE